MTEHDDLYAQWLAETDEMEAAYDAMLRANGWTDADLAAYDAWCEAEQARHDAECGCPWEGGPAHDPYGTNCDLPKGHDGDHSGPNPFGPGLNGEDEPITWTRRQGARFAMRGYE